MKTKIGDPSAVGIKNLINFKTVILLFLIIIILPLSCKPIDHGQKFINGVPFELKVGESLSLSYRLSFSIDSLQDGRCPIGMFCLWPGDASLLFNLNQNSNQIDTMICLSYCNTNPFQLAGYTFKVLDITPYPDIHIKIDPRGIKIKMVVTEN
jgi:hypothetical protein